MCNPDLCYTFVGSARQDSSVSTGEQTVLIDPYLSRINKRRLLFGRPTPNEAAHRPLPGTLPAPLSAILVGHTHVDHALDVPAFARARCGACRAIVGSRSLDTLLRAHGLPDRVRVCEGERRWPWARA